MHNCILCGGRWTTLAYCTKCLEDMAIGRYRAHADDPPTVDGVRVWPDGREGSST